MFEKVLCISLESRTDRREHVVRELERMRLVPFVWIDAIGKGSEAVKRALADQRVKAYPPCFRCGRNQCDCENRRLMPEQIATWLSHEMAWRQVAPRGLSLICEDDVKFTPRASEGMAFLAESADIRGLVEAGAPLLLRLGRALTDRHRSLDAFRLDQQVSMSNPCYALTHSMSEFLLEASSSIYTTVDIFVHRDRAPLANHNTLDPPLAYELSWSTGELRSDIRPKQVYLDRQRALLRELDPEDPRHRAAAAEVEREEARFRAHRAFERGED